MPTVLSNNKGERYAYLTQTQRQILVRRTNVFADFPNMAWPSTALLTRTNEILSQAANYVWAGELELMRLEAEQVSKSLFPFRHNGDAGGQAADSREQWHNNAEEVIAQMRHVGDVMRNCGWQLFEVYSKSLKPYSGTRKAAESRS